MGRGHQGLHWPECRQTFSLWKWWHQVQRILCVLVPQKLGENSVMLGMFTLDAEKVPILIGMRTLDRLGAVIDVSGCWMVLSNVAPDLKIPLGKSKAGHLLVDLRTDWLTMGQPLEQHAPRPRAAYKVSSPLCAVSPMDHEDCHFSDLPRHVGPPAPRALHEF